ncbi:MAG TPA: molybdopterin-guanine dinucleotide biosynthesis protein B [Gemmatimonadaceae bacterium]|nr:molybdopterin-guanine dinucleotide biosynthesis protein B [Gemmatimonadaceae bacterium]
MPRPPILAIVGTKKHGKTTLTVRLAAALKRRGHRVMTIKHGTHTFDLDPAATDTYRHYHEGEAEKVAMVSPDKFALVERSSAERTPEEIVDAHMMDADIVLCEGFKGSALRRVEIWRREAGGTPLLDASNAGLYLALATDDDSVTAPGVRIVLTTTPDWIGELAGIVEREMIRSRRSS